MCFRSLAALAICGVLAQATELTDAARSQDRKAIVRLLQQKADVNATEADGTTALHWAARNGDVETVRQLVKAGAKPSLANRLGVTALSLAASSRATEVARVLLSAGADPNAAADGGETVLMAAARAGAAAVIEELVKKGAQVEAGESQFGATALMLAAGENQAEAVRALIRAGAQVNSATKSLTYAKDRFGLEGVLTILPHGAWTPLLYGARQGSTDAIRALADAGADVNAADRDGTTPLLAAIVNGHFDTAALLLEKGAKVNAADSAGMTPLYAAVDMNTLGEVFGQPPRPATGEMGALDLLKLLLARGANANAQLKTPTLQRAHTPGEPTLNEGATALMRAAKNGDSAAIELLIERGADVNLAQKNGATPLMFAAGLGRGVSAFAKDYGTEAELLAAAKLLVAHGANVNAKSVAGLTPIHYGAQAADANFPQPTDAILRFLLAQGANVSVADNQGRTPVDMAMGKGLCGRAGGPVKPREETAALLKELIEKAK